MCKSILWDCGANSSDWMRKERNHIQALMPIEFDIRYIHKFVEVMQSYKSQMEMVIAGLETPGKKPNGAKYPRSPNRPDNN